MPTHGAAIIIFFLNSVTTFENGKWKTENGKLSKYFPFSIIRFPLKKTMFDLIFIAAIVGFFILALGYIRFCGNLSGETKK